MNDEMDAAASRELCNILEAALLVSEEPLTLEKMLSMFPEPAPSRDDIRAALDQLERDYATRGLSLKRIERGYRIQTRDHYAPWLQRLKAERPPRYSRALLETLAIIAYRQPVTRGDVEDIRGVSVSTETIKTLMGREWIRQVGVKPVPGQPALYATTRAFLEYFNLSSLEDLPPLNALRDLADIGNALEAAMPNSTHSEALADHASETPSEDAQAEPVSAEAGA